MSAVCSSYFIFLVFVAVHLTFSLRILKISWHVKNEHFTLKNPNGKCLLDIYIYEIAREEHKEEKKKNKTPTIRNMPEINNDENVMKTFCG